MELLLLALTQPKAPLITQPPEPPAIVETVEPIRYQVVEADNLTKIANKHNILVERLWAKNTQLVNQDKVTVGEQLVIPTPNEILAPRPFVNPEPINVSTLSQTSVRGAQNGLNGYDYPSCTGHVALKRYVPPGWGDASNWKSAAIKAGWTVSSDPMAGAIGWKPGHVVFVEAVSGNTVTISENNYDWNGSTRTITVEKGAYVYLF